MITQQQIQELMGGKASIVDRDGEKIGKLEQVYLDDRTNEPHWATASTGLFGSAESFVPLRGARIIAGELEVQYSKDVVKDAPRLDSGEHLASAQEEELYRYYGLTAEPEPDADARAGEAGAAEVDARVAIQETGPGGNKLRKYVVTEVREEPNDGGSGR